MISRLRFEALQLVRAFASWRGYARLHRWAWDRIVDTSDQEGA